MIKCLYAYKHNRARPRKKKSLEESLAESHAYNPIRDSGEKSLG